MKSQLDIPDYLRGKSSAMIVDEMRRRFYQQGDVGLVAFANHLVGLLLLAVAHAQCNCDKTVRTQELIDGIEDGPGGRAVAFLNMVLPYRRENV